MVQMRFRGIYPNKVHNMKIVEYLADSHSAPIQLKVDKISDGTVVCSFKWIKQVADIINCNEQYIRLLKMDIPLSIAILLKQSGKVEFQSSKMKNNTITFKMNDGSEIKSIKYYDAIHGMVIMTEDAFERLNNNMKVRASSTQFSEVCGLEKSAVIPGKLPFVPDYIMHELQSKPDNLDEFCNYLDKIASIYKDHVWVHNIEDSYDYNFEKKSQKVQKLPGGKLQYIVHDNSLVPENHFMAFNRELCEEWKLSPSDFYLKTLAVFNMDTEMFCVFKFMWYDEVPPRNKCQIST